MRPIVIISIAILLGGLVAIISGNFSDQDQTTGSMEIDQTTGSMEIDETKPWLGLSCDEMLDFSASDKHQDITPDLHMEFHEYYFDNCSEIKFEMP